MKHCKHCNDTLFTEIYDTCMTCFEKQPTESTMTKTIDQYEGDCLWYQREIKRLESCCSNLQGVVKGDAYNIKRLSEENERLVKIYNDQKNILHEILHELPVGNITTHTYENIPDRVKYYVREHALLESHQDEANELISQSMPNFFDHPEAGYILDNIALLIGIADKAKIEAWGDREDLEALQEEIKTCYEYYAGFAANKNLTSFQMLDTLFKSKPGYNHVDSKQNECLVDDNRKLHAELAKCIKDTMSIENERDECKKLAVEQYLHIEELDKENENNFQLIVKLIEERDGYQEQADTLLARLGTTQERMIDAERERDKLKCERNLWKAEESAHYKAALDENEYLLEQLEALKDKSRLFKSAQDGQEYLRCLHQRGNKHQSVGLWVEDAVAYKAALEEIVKRPRKSETCKLIAQKALGQLNDEVYQPELLIEENLALKIKIEDLQAVIASELLNKVFPQP